MTKTTATFFIVYHIMYLYSIRYGYSRLDGALGLLMDMAAFRALSSWWHSALYAHTGIARFIDIHIS